MEIVGPALLLGPQLGIVCRGVNLELELVGVDNLLAAVLALGTLVDFFSPVDKSHTIEVGLGALTGRPLALTGARVPAASAFLLKEMSIRCPRIMTTKSPGLLLLVSSVLLADRHLK